MRVALFLCLVDFPHDCIVFLGPENCRALDMDPVSISVETLGLQPGVYFIVSPNGEFKHEKLIVTH